MEYSTGQFHILNFMNYSLLHTPGQFVPLLLPQVSKNDNDDKEHCLFKKFGFNNVVEYYGKRIKTLHGCLFERADLTGHGHPTLFWKKGLGWPCPVSVRSTLKSILIYQKIWSPFLPSSYFLTKCVLDVGAGIRLIKYIPNYVLEFLGIVL